MLTGNLVKYKIRSGHIKAQFVAVDNTEHLLLAKQLISFYQVENGYTRKEIDDFTNPIINSYNDVIFAKGLNKLIIDRTQFSNTSDIDFKKLREQAFANSAKIIQEAHIDHFDLYQNKISKLCNINLSELKNNLYADLQENEKIVKIKKIFPKELLERYNSSLIQSHLLYANCVDLTIEDANSAKIRRIFKYLKFFRLLAKIIPLDKKNKRKTFTKLKIIIDGPLNLFEHTRKYGLQLASFFPAICSLEKWELKTTIKIKGKLLKLNIDNTAALVDHYHNFSAYIPEEILMFHTLFKDTVTDWTIVDNTPFLHTNNEDFIFPDLCFKSKKTKKRVYLELFHNWHSAQLEKRIKYLKKNKISLIIGIDSKLYKKMNIKILLEDAKLEDVFSFNNFPGVQKTLKLLNKHIP